MDGRMDGNVTMEEHVNSAQTNPVLFILCSAIDEFSISYHKPNKSAWASGHCYRFQQEKNCDWFLHLLKVKRLSVSLLITLIVKNDITCCLTSISL